MTQAFGAVLTPSRAAAIHLAERFKALSICCGHFVRKGVW